MKLLFRLSLTTLSLLLFLLLAYLALPSLLSEFARYQLSQLGFTDIEINVGPVGLESATIDYAELSNQGIRISLQNLKNRLSAGETAVWFSGRNTYRRPVPVSDL